MSIFRTYIGFEKIYVYLWNINWFWKDLRPSLEHKLGLNRSTVSLNKKVLEVQLSKL